MERSRLFDLYMAGKDWGRSGLPSNQEVKCISVGLGVGVVIVSANLSYLKLIYKLESKSSNSRKCARYRMKKK